jgi:hypothetical protein
VTGDRERAADGKLGLPWERDTLVPVFSTTQGLARQSLDEVDRVLLVRDRLLGVNEAAEHPLVPSVLQTDEAGFVGRVV